MVLRLAKNYEPELKLTGYDWKRLCLPDLERRNRIIAAMDYMSVMYSDSCSPLGNKDFLFHYNNFLQDSDYKSIIHVNLNIKGIEYEKEYYA